MTPPCDCAACASGSDAHAAFLAALEAATEARARHEATVYGSWRDKMLASENLVTPRVVAVRDAFDRLTRARRGDR